MRPEALEALRGELGPRVRTAEQLAPYTTFRIGGPADLFYESECADDLAAAVLAARKHGVPWSLLAVAANVLVGVRGFRGLVSRNRARRIDILAGGLVRAESGVLVDPDLIEAAVSRGLSGLEHYVGIPSTVGGALW